MTNGQIKQRCHHDHAAIEFIRDLTEHLEEININGRGAFWMMLFGYR